MTKPAPDSTPFATPDAFWDWLAAHHATETELWVRIYKKGSGIPSVTWDDCVRAGLAWGWIDGQKRSLDATAYLQRFTPRRPKSSWSERNRKIVADLIERGEMQPSGLVHVEAAKADGRWDLAYAGQADMVIPADFLAAVEASPRAKARFATLTRSEMFPFYHRLHTARTPEVRAARFAKLLSDLES